MPQRGSVLKVLTGVAALALVVAGVVLLQPREEGSRGLAAMAPAGANAGAGDQAAVAYGEAELVPIVIVSDKVDLSPPLRDIPAVVSPPELEAPENEVLPGRTGGSVDQDEVAAILQDWHGAVDMPAPIQNWEGIPNLSTVFPPDTEGEVGLNHYVQWVNLWLQIWDKSGNSLYGPVDGNTPWTGFGGPCEDTNDGDPIVLYDQLADRWILSQFALPNYYLATMILMDTDT